MRESTRHLDQYMGRIRKIKLLTAEEERELARRYQANGDPEARRRLCEANLRFVVKMAHQFARRGVPLEDLIQEGNMGLLRAIQTYDPEHGVRFLTYGRHWIAVYMRRLLVRNHSVVRFGTTPLQQRLYFQWQALRRKQLKGKKGNLDEEDLEELAEFLKTTPEKLEQIEARLAQPDVSADMPVGDPGSGTSLLSMIANADEGPEVLAGELEYRSQLHRAVVGAAIDLLSPRERVVLRRRLTSEEPATLQELGDELGVSRERVRQIEGAILHKLREPLSRVAQEA